MMEVTSDDLAVAVKAEADRRSLMVHLLVFGTAVALTVALALLAVLLVLRDRSTLAETNGVRIDALTAALDEARGQLTAGDQAALDVASCELRYVVALRDANREYLASLGGLLIRVASLPPDEGRGVASADEVAEVEVTLARYRLVATAYSSWQSDGRSMPCPIGPL
jgi:hypothetical protein